LMLIVSISSCIRLLCKKPTASSFRSSLLMWRLTPSLERTWSRVSPTAKSDFLARLTVGTPPVQANTPSVRAGARFQRAFTSNLRQIRARGRSSNEVHCAAVPETAAHLSTCAVLTNARLVTSRKFLSRTSGFSHSSLLDTSPWVKNEGRLSKNRKSLTTPLPRALRSRVSRLSWSY